MKLFFLKFVVLLLLILNSNNTFATVSDIRLISDIDTVSFRKNSINYYQNQVLPISIKSFPQIFTLEIISNNKVSVGRNENYQLIDTIRQVNDSLYRCTIKFLELDSKLISNLIIKEKSEDKILYTQFKILQYQPTSLNYFEDDIEFLQEEERVIELPAQNLYNIKFESVWNYQFNLDYRLTYGINSIKLQIRPHKLGEQTFNLNLKSHRPFINSKGILTQDLDPIEVKFDTKQNRLDFVNCTQDFVFYSLDVNNYEEIQLEYNKNIILRKTYRIENQQEKGGNMIGELFTQSILGSNKVICRLRTFGLHRVNDGYLYLKDGDKARFITNFNIIEKPRIEKLSVMHDGEDWTTNPYVFPGEKIEVKIEGKGLEKSRFQFDGILNAVLDTERISDEAIFYTVSIPFNITKNKIGIYMNKKATQYTLSVKEYQLPSELDFVTVDYGDKDISLVSNQLNKPIFYEGLLKDVTFNFNPSLIDNPTKLFGKQYLNIEIRILNAKGDLVEFQNISDIVICPNENSPRGIHYDQQGCKYQSAININDYIAHKTYNLGPFYQVLINISHIKEKYSQAGYNKKIKLIMNRKTSFDIQVSFPAGLFLHNFRTNSYRTLSGISIAAIAEFGFYKPNEINRLRPFTFGAGFVGLNTFNLNSAAFRDLGVVVLGTITPVLNNKKLSFPLYLGGGYLLQEKAWFAIFGPGIRINF